MSENAFTGLVFCIVVAVLVYRYHNNKILAQRGRGQEPLNYAEDCFEIGPRRPYVVHNGVLREVLHRTAKDGLRVECTLRPEIKGGHRPKITVSKDDVIWAEKGVQK